MVCKKNVQKNDFFSFICTIFFKYMTGWWFMSPVVHVYDLIHLFSRLLRNSGRNGWNIVLLIGG
jgi:hypothetical protein